MIVSWIVWQHYLPGLCRQRRDKPSEEQGGRTCAGNLRRDKTRSVYWTNSAKRVACGARQCHGRIGERGGSSEPICSRDVSGHGEGHHWRSKLYASPNDCDQTKRGDKLTEDLTCARACLM